MNTDTRLETKDLIQDINHVSKHRSLSVLESRSLKLLKQSVKEQIEK